MEKLLGTINGERNLYYFLQRFSRTIDEEDIEKKIQKIKKESEILNDLYFITKIDSFSLKINNTIYKLDHTNTERNDIWFDKLQKYIENDK